MTGSAARPMAMNYLNRWGVALLVFSYPITTVWLIQIGWQSSAMNMIIKGLIAAIFAGALLAIRPGVTRNLGVIAPLMIFFILYGVRLLYDVLLQDILYEFQSRLYTLGYFFGLTLLPCITAALCVSRDSPARLHRLLFVAAILANISLFYFVSTSGQLATESAFSGRFEVEGDLEGTAVLNPILVGLMGAVLVSFTMGRIAVVATSTIRDQVFYAGLIALGAVNLLFGASRGPALALAASFSIALYAVIRGQRARKAGLKFRQNLWIYAALLIFAITYLVVTQAFSIQLFERFGTMFGGTTGRQFEERDIIFAEAWNDFFRSPLIGFSYVTTSGYSPHNVILEALMSTGIIGGFWLALAFFHAIKGTWRMLRGSAGPSGFAIALIAICYFVVGMTSGSIGQFPEFWIFTTLVTVLGRSDPAPARPQTAIVHPTSKWA